LITGSGSGFGVEFKKDKLVEGNSLITGSGIDVEFKKDEAVEGNSLITGSGCGVGVEFKKDELVEGNSVLVSVSGRGVGLADFLIVFSLCFLPSVFLMMKAGIFVGCSSHFSQQCPTYFRSFARVVDRKWCIFGKFLSSPVTSKNSTPLAVSCQTPSFNRKSAIRSR